MSIEHFSSLPPEEERHFVVFEEFSRNNAKRANIIGWGAAGAFTVVLLLIVSAFWGTAPKPNFEAEEEAAAAQVVPGTAPTQAAPAPAPVPTDTAPAGAAPATPPAATPPAATPPAATP